MSYQTVYLHRVIAEQTIGRKLRPGEVVHHLDGDKTNNSPENLVVCSSASVHGQYHIWSLHQKMEADRLVRQGDLWF
ncbi:HNH endonuclease signature motif containing protein [Microcoleus sp. F10-C6]|uniref:HNH endonuclease signature motif containing protein n=1 Tax=unclassified Microcoleus TaxID=2642155 RepID=UPI002FD568F5